MDTPTLPPETHVAARLSTLDRFLPVWIGLAMVAGLLLGRLVPGLGGWLSAVEVDGISLPIALGLLVMMYPVLAKVRYDALDSVTRDRRLLVPSLVLNSVSYTHLDVYKRQALTWPRWSGQRPARHTAASWTCLSCVRH